MKRKIEFYQKYITKLKALVEEDRGVADLFTNLRNDDIMDKVVGNDDQENRTINIASNGVDMGM